MQPTNLDQFRAGIRGRPYKALVQHHLKKQNQGNRIDGLYATIDLILPELHPALENYIDRWNERAYDRSFWQRDCANVFDDMIEEARALLRSDGRQEDDETLFNFFQAMTLTFAANAAEQPAMRRFAGIKKGWFS